MLFVETLMVVQATSWGGIEGTLLAGSSLRHKRYILEHPDGDPRLVNFEGEGLPPNCTLINQGLSNSGFALGPMCWNPSPKGWHAALQIQVLQLFWQFTAGVRRPDRLNKH